MTNDPTTTDAVIVDRPGTGVTTRRIGLVVGPLLFAVAALVAASATGSERDQWLAVGTVAWTAAWWFTEAVPIAATSLLPAILLPAAGVLEPAAAYASYADAVVLLFLGGFVVALAIEHHGLHRRAALLALAAAGSGPRSLLAAVMVVSAVLSAWISNTAAAMMLLPIVVSLGAGARAAGASDDGDDVLVRRERALLLGMAYATTLGGMATLIGTPPNAILAGIAGDLTGTEIGFARWMLFAMPMSIGLLVATWLLLVASFRLPRRSSADAAARASAREQLHALGRPHGVELRVLGVFVAMALAWATRPLWADHLPFHVDDTTIALCAALACFVLPGTGGDRILRWSDTQRLPWGVLLLLGGGLALAGAFTASGLDTRVGDALGSFADASTWILVAATVVVTVLVTEVASNTASAAALIPLAAAVGTATGIDPLVLAVAAAVGSTCGFMMPAGTPPIALAFSTGRLPVPTLVRVGAVLDVVAVLVVTVAVVTGVELVWG